MSLAEESMSLVSICRSFCELENELRRSLNCVANEPSECGKSCHQGGSDLGGGEESEEFTAPYGFGGVVRGMNILIGSVPFGISIPFAVTFPLIRVRRNVDLSGSTKSRELPESMYIRTECGDGLGAQ
jgi:hypothetical protein